jgi:hypothetical protein
MNDERPDEQLDPEALALWAVSDLNDTELDQFVHHLEIR